MTSSRFSESHPYTGTVLTVTALVNGKSQNLTPCRIETP